MVIIVIFAQWEDSWEVLLLSSLLPYLISDSAAELSSQEVRPSNLYYYLSRLELKLHRGHAVRLSFAPRIR